jgi:hypothetical protein
MSSSVLILHCNGVLEANNHCFRDSRFLDGICFIPFPHLSMQISIYLIQKFSLQRAGYHLVLCIYFGPVISCAYAPGYIQTFVSWTLFDLSNRKPLKNSSFVSCSVLTDFCQYLCLPLYRFLLSSFDHGTFGEVATVVCAIYVVVLSWNLKQKEVDYMLCLH